MQISSSNTSHTFDTATNLTNNDNGFTYSNLNIEDGEIITFVYSAKIDYSKVLGDTFTVDETKNTVTVSGGNTDNDNSKDSSYTEKVGNTPFTKFGSTSEDGNIVTTTWTITVNGSYFNILNEAKALTDTLNTANVNAKYSGNGLTIVKKKKNETGGKILYLQQMYYGLML